jgi:hypothetical protein
MPFDVKGALKDGYSPAEIADYLASKRNFDIAGARKDGFTDDEILGHLASRVDSPKVAAVEEPKSKPLPEGVVPSEGRSATPMGKPDPRLIGSEPIATTAATVPAKAPVVAAPVAEQGFIAKTMKEGDYLGSSLERGWNSLKMSVNGQKMAEYGELLDLFNKKYTPEQIAADPALQKEKLLRETSFAKAAQENAQLSKENETILKSARTRPASQKLFGVGSEATGWLDTAAEIGKAVIQDPGSVVDLALSSGPSTVASLAASTMAYLGTRNPRLAAAAGGAGSGYVEFGNEYSENRASGMGHDEAWKAAAAKAGVVGALDAVSMGSAGKAMDTIVNAVKSGATRTAVKEVGLETAKQGALGAAGEAGGAFAAGKEIDPRSVLLEAVGETVSAPVEALTTRNQIQQDISPEYQLAKAINEGVANTRFTGTDQIARDLLNPNSYDNTLMNPVDTSRISAATSVDEAVAAAMDTSGTVTVPAMTQMPVPLAANIPPPLDAGEGRIEPTFDPNAPLATTPTMAAPITLPAANPTTEQQFGLDKLRMSAPRPQKIQGVAVSQLSNNQLQTISNDETIPAITRRGASVELTARQAEAGKATPATGVSEAPAVPLANATEQTTITPGEALVIPTAQPMPSAAATPVGGQAAADTARATAQESLDRWAASNNVETPATLNPAAPDAEAAVNEIANALNSQFGGKIYAYNDDRPSSVNGLAIGGAAFVNTANVDFNVTRTALHEFKHTVEQIARIESRQGLTNTPAQKFVADIDSIFTDMTDEGKASYVANFLHKAELDAIADPVAKKQRLQELMAAPGTMSEMTADFLGNRATDKKFWKDVAAADPQGFKGFVDKWLAIVDNLLASLKGKRNQGSKESARVDKYIRDLNKAKAVARDALVAYSKAQQGNQNGNTSTATGEGVSGPSASARSVTGEDGGGQTPEYGTPRSGAISVLGRHYSTQSRTALNGAYYGRGLKGAERDRLDNSPDPRLKSRIYFYVDQGAGVRPEAGVGGIAHEVQLNNIYDPKTQIVPVKGNFNAFESAVINAGFDGYIAPFGNNQAAVVLLGGKHNDVPVKVLGQVASAAAPAAQEPTTLKKSLLSKEMAAIEASRVPGAKVRGGNLEIPVESRDAANVELERIGSDARFSKKQKTEEPVVEEVKDLGTFKDVADDLGLSKEQYAASVLGLMTGKTKSDAFETPNVGGIPEVVQWLDQRYRDAGMPTLDLNKAEDRSTLARMMAAEAIGAIRSAGNAVEWYDETVAKTLRVMAVKYPELNTDPNARNAFLMATAIASQTMNVEDNLRYASNQYESFRETGEFPEQGTGKSAPAMAKNFALANSLLRAFGPVDLRRFLQTELTKRDLEGMGFNIGGESMDEKVLGSAVFGPKIGFGFYSNLSGNFEPVTMDMWFMRTVGRLTGTLPAFDEVLFPKQVAKLRAALTETGDSAEGVYAADFKPEDVAAAQQSDEGAIALARKIYSLHNRQFIKERAKFDAGLRKKTAMVGAASAILKSADKPTDSPSSGGERQRLRSVVREMVDLVEKQTGKRVPPAALQALIWYPEQELYKKLGVRLRVTSQDYAGAAQSLLKKEGFDAKRINAATKSGSGSARQVAGKQNAATAGQASGAGPKLGAFEGSEKAEVVNRLTEQTLIRKAQEAPLAEVFEKLDGRGIGKRNAEALVNRRSDAAQIQYIQDNFLDILDELDTAGLVEINCK